MSLINQMLKDLEARRQQNAEPPQDPGSQELQVPPGSPRRRSVLLWGIPVLLLAVGLAGALWWYGDRGKPPAASQVHDTLVREPIPERSTSPLKSGASVDTRIRLLEIRGEQHPGFWRLALEFTGAPQAELEPRDDGRRLQLRFANLTADELPAPALAESPYLAAARWRTEAKEVLLELELTARYPFRQAILAPGSNVGARVIIDLIGPAAAATPPSLADSVPAAAAAPPAPVEPVPAAGAAPAVSAPPAVAASAPAAQRPAVTGPGVSRRQAVVPPAQRAETLYAKAASALQLGRREQAEALLHQLLELDPGHRAGRETLVELLLRSGRISEAATLLAQSLTQFPGHAGFRRQYARILLDQGELVRARQLLEQDDRPSATTDPDYYALLGALQQRLGDAAAAADSYRAALVVRPLAGDWWVGLGIALENTGQPGAARQAYQRALDSQRLSSALVDFARQRLAQFGPATSPAATTDRGATR